MDLAALAAASAAFLQEMAALPCPAAPAPRPPSRGRGAQPRPRGRRPVRQPSPCRAAAPPPPAALEPKFEQLLRLGMEPAAGGGGHEEEDDSVGDLVSLLVGGTLGQAVDDFEDEASDDDCATAVQVLELPLAAIEEDEKEELADAAGLDTTAGPASAAAPPPAARARPFLGLAAMLLEGALVGAASDIFGRIDVGDEGCDDGPAPAPPSPAPGEAPAGPARRPARPSRGGQAGAPSPAARPAPERCGELGGGAPEVPATPRGASRPRASLADGLGAPSPEPSAPTAPATPRGGARRPSGGRRFAPAAPATPRRGAARPQVRRDLAAATEPGHAAPKPAPQPAPRPARAPSPAAALRPVAPPPRKKPHAKLVAPRAAPEGASEAIASPRAPLVSAMALDLDLGPAAAAGARAGDPAPGGAAWARLPVFALEDLVGSSSKRVGSLPPIHGASGKSGDVSWKVAAPRPSSRGARAVDWAV